MTKCFLILAAALVLGAGIVHSAGLKSGYLRGKYAIELDGVTAGWLHSAEGGHATADVVVEKLGETNLQKKHLGGVKFEDLTVQMGVRDLVQNRHLSGWIQGTFLQKPERKSGALVAADYNYREHSRHSFSNALISEVGFPALDGASKDAAYLTLKLSPEATLFKPGSGEEIKVEVPAQKKWLPANFRFEIDGLDTTRVNKIDSFTVKQKVVDSDGSYLLETPRLHLDAGEPSAKSFADWFQDFVIKGNNGDEAERTGKLVFLESDLKTVLFSLVLRNLGISGLTYDKEGAAPGAQIELYFEKIEILPGN